MLVIEGKTEKKIDTAVPMRKHYNNDGAKFL